MSCLYLLHFDRPLSHAQHYLGFTDHDDVQERIARHAKGHGSRLCRAVAAAGIGWRLVRTWPGGDRTLERRLKNRKNGPLLCPVCMAAAGGGKRNVKHRRGPRARRKDRT